MLLPRHAIIERLVHERAGAMVQPSFLGRNVEMLEHAIAAKLAVLGLDPTNAQQMRDLAREALDTDPQKISQHFYASSLEPRVRAELLGLIALMFQTMPPQRTWGRSCTAAPCGRPWRGRSTKKPRPAGSCPQKGRECGPILPRLLLDSRRACGSPWKRPDWRRGIWISCMKRPGSMPSGAVGWVWAMSPSA